MNQIQINFDNAQACTIPRVMCWACDNLELLKSQPNESVDLIYSDILYGTGRNFGEYQDLKPKRDVIESHYLPRLIEMKRVLKQNGSIYLQMDTRINHWMRILMDDVFGYEHFRNEICWKYDKWSNVSNCFQRNHDVILFYSFKGAVFNELRELIEAPRKRNLVEIIDGKKVSKRIDGEVVYREQFDRPISDVFTDIPRIPNTGAKVIGYATQKPKELISRFVLASTNEGDVVADYYLGSGTTAEVCKELNRNFIGCDINPNAIEITKSRLNAGT
ncbi:MAG: site-specific DNA-methyltransferase [Chitinophagales bacterium]|nr:site-specific DNA-methyltransferase [Chitinophagales bacterium]